MMKSSTHDWLLYVNIEYAASMGVGMKACFKFAFGIIGEVGLMSLSGGRMDAFKPPVCCFCETGLEAFCGVNNDGLRLSFGLLGEM